MSIRRYKPDGPEKRLTLKSIRNDCSWKVFELGKEYRDQDRATNVALQKDGTLSGTILGTDMDYPKDMIEDMILEYMVERPQKERRVLVSLQNGSWHCSCPYSRVDVCSHVAALLICAVKDLKVTVPAAGLSIRRESTKRTIAPYREDAARILSQDVDIESASADIDRLLELAFACQDEGDLLEAIMVCLGIADALLLGLDYQAYSGYFRLYPDMPEAHVPPSTREPDGVDAMRVHKFCYVLRKATRMLSYSRMLHEQKVPCIIAAHRLYMKTVPWGPSHLYSRIFTRLPNTDKDYEFLRGLHDPVVPASTPDPSKDPIRFRTAIDLARYQSLIYRHLKDDSLLERYARHYRDAPGACVRYAWYLHHMGDRRRATEVAAEGRCLFPDVDVWDEYL